MKKNFKLPLITSLIGCALSSQAVQAQTYTWDLADNINIINAQEGTNFTSISDIYGGSMTSLSASYDSNNQIFCWETTLGRIPEYGPNSTPDASTPDGDRIPDAYTLIVNSGTGTPDASVSNEVVQLNVDFTDINNPLLTAYSYVNGGTTHDGALLISSTDTSDIQTLEVTQPTPEEVRIKLCLDATALNSSLIGPDWEGLQFNENIGVWFNYYTGVTTGYNADGSMNLFATYGGTDDASWFDIDTLPTKTVPEPSAVLLLGIASLSLLNRRSR